MKAFFELGNKLILLKKGKRRGDFLHLSQNFKVKISFALYSTRHEGKTFPKNLIVLLKNDKKVSLSFNIDAYVLTATLWFWTLKL